MVSSIGVDLTACWRPRAGMLTVAVGLTGAMLAANGGDRRFTLFCSRERPPALAGTAAAATRAVLSPHRHEVLNKLRWLPAVEADAGLDAILYPYWPCPPRRRAGAPPAVVFVHDLAYRIRPGEVPWQQRVYMGSIMAGALRRAGAVLTPSEATRRDLLEHYPLTGLERRVRVVPEGCSLLGVEPGPLPDGLAPGFLLAVGTIEPRKNYPRLLAAYRLLKARGGAPPLVVAGRVGWAYGRALDELRAEPGVQLLTDVDDAGLLGLYRAAGALAFPSLYEGFGLPLLEAMAEGLPALVGDAGALPELAGEAALLVDPRDVEAIAGGLERVLGDTELRARLTQAGPRRAADYTWERGGAATLDVLDSLR
jgi:glycosyltransferase involved in cell wall biosynthesis